jgi:adenylate cyclase
VVEDDGDLYGDGVNVAARLEQLAEPGGMLISGTVYDHLQGKLACDLSFVGERVLKKIVRPVRVYHVGWQRPPVDEQERSSARLAQPRNDRSAAVHQHEQRSRAGIFRRWPGRRPPVSW